MTTIYHVSDLHFGHAAVPEQIDAIEAQIASGKYDVVAISGDISQRARSGELQRGQSFIRDARRVSEVIVVPGNHDVRWWQAPLGIGNYPSITSHYRQYVCAELEPVLRVEGATFVGLNTAQGVLPSTLTWRMKDISIIGYLSAAQLARAQAEFEKSPVSDCRVIVMHHNPMRGELSQRFGLKNAQKTMSALAEMGVDLVLCGHDHQEAVHYVEHTSRGTVVSTAGTVSNRSRGGRPASLNSIQVSGDQIAITTLVWNPAAGAFVEGPHEVFRR